MSPLNTPLVSLFLSERIVAFLMNKYWSILAPKLPLGYCAAVSAPTGYYMLLYQSIVSVFYHRLS